MQEKAIEPTHTKIPHNSRTKRLYSLENQLHEVLKGCALEWLKVNGMPEKEMWSRAVPQAMFDLMDSFDSDCSEAACKAYLRSRGFDIP